MLCLLRPPPASYSSPPPSPHLSPPPVPASTSMASPPFDALVLVLLLAASVSNSHIIPPSPSPAPSQTLRLPAHEQQAAYLALEAASPDTPWRYLYPDDLCLSGPHGLVCDLFPSDDPSSSDVALHVVELNFGYLSEFSSNPSCKPNATLPASLPFPFLRKLLFYNCFAAAAAGGPTLDAAFWTSLPPSLEELVFIRNPSLGGRLSGSIAGLRRLRRLVISGSRISGAIPLETGGLRQLEQLVLSGNLIRGEIPRTVGRLGRLKILDLSGNRLGGSLPIEIGRLRDLAMLDLSSNRLAGPVPNGFAGLQRLELLDLRANRLTGGIPAALAEMTSLKEVYLDDNKELGGTIPEIWEKLGSLLGIGLSGVGLVGDIPASMGVFLRRLCYLALDNNQLQGELPEELKRLESSASEINLENNGLHGRVPFSAGFIGRMGGKLKLQGNPGLCLADHVAGSLRRCNTSETPRAVVLFTSDAVPSLSLRNCYGLPLSLGFFIFILILLP